MTETIDLFTNNGLRKYLTPDERRDFIKAAKAHRDTKARTFCLTLAYTGCRISEALELNYKRVDLDAGQLVFRSLKKRDGKVHHRAVPVPPEHLDALNLVHDVSAIKRRGRKTTERLWPFARMTGWRRVSEVMEAADISGAHASPKGLRHAFGVHALVKDIPLPLLQRWMGHANLETTSIYLQVIGNEERGFASRLWEDV